ncbi:hypothetical protein FACS189476_12440 [Spirochaetia bacterium]|nr:hypothetical protein FACS189476_12440 [Spirochaetia bacterium]
MANIKRLILSPQVYHVLNVLVLFAKLFDVIIISRCYTHFDGHNRNQTYIIRRFISDVYLGPSRASRHLLITSNVEGGEVSQDLLLIQSIVNI